MKNVTIPGWSWIVLWVVTGASTAYGEGAGNREGKRVATLRALGAQIQYEEADPQSPAKRRHVIGVKLTQKQIQHFGLWNLEYLPHLTSLDLTGAKITDATVVPLRRLTRLRSLNLAHTSVTAVAVWHLARLKNLENLDLGGTKVTDPALRSIAKFKRLKRLNLSGTLITSYGVHQLNKLRQLEDLDLSDTQIDDTALVRLPEMPTLKRVDISRTGVTRRQAQRLRKSLGKTKFVYNTGRTTR